jgi:HAD superfamily hydrolase (TIGR01509 family)
VQQTLRGIIFDFGGVLTRTGPRDRVLHRCEMELGLPPGTLLQLLFAGEHWWGVSTGRISEDEYWRPIVDRLEGKVPEALKPFKQNPFAYEELNQRVVALARALRKRHTLALLSNATPALEGLLAENHLDTVFNVVVNSARVGLRKPDPAIYALALDRIGLAAAQCLLVDDKERNTKAAERLGLQAMVFRSARDLVLQLERLGVATS